MPRNIHSGSAIGALYLRAPGEIEAEIADFIDRAAMLIRYHAERHSIDGTTKLGDLMALPVEPSGKALGELTWAEMLTAHEYYAARASELNAPFCEQIEII